MYKNIDAEIARRGMSLESFADKLGVTRKTFYNWQATGKIPATQLIKIAKMFNCSITQPKSKQWRRL